MSREQGLTFADFVEQVAGKTGLRVNKRDEMCIVVSFDMGEGRKQSVWVMPVGVDGKDNLVVGFSSPALKMSATQQLNQKAANKLLFENSELLHGAWAIKKVGDSRYVVATDTQIAQTMDPAEFAASVAAVAKAADTMEKELGADSF